MMKRNYQRSRRGKTNRLKAKQKARVLRKRALSPHGKRSKGCHLLCK